MIPIQIVRTVDRYITKEFIGPFLLCLFGFTVIMISGTLFELVDLILVKKVAVSIVFKMMGYKLPSIMIDILPAAVLFSTLLSLSRLSKDSELTVMRMAGLGLFRIIMPMIICATIVSVGTFYADEYIVPWTNHQFNNMLRKLYFEDPIPQIEQDVFFRSENHYFYVRKIQRGTNRVEGVMVYEVRSKGYPRIITAKEGYSVNGIWTLINAIIHELDDEGFTRYEGKTLKMELRVNRNTDQLFGEQKTTQEMSRKELKSHIDLFTRSAVDVKPFIVDYYIKLAMPFASLIFTLMGAPLSIWASKGGRFYGIAISVVITLLYYVSASVLRSFGSNGALPPQIAAWLPNIVFAASGIFLLQNTR